VNKTDLISRMKDKFPGMTQAKAQELVDYLFDEIEKTLGKGEQVNLSGFGSFEVKSRAARTGRNPQTGEPITIPAKKAVTFKPAAGLKRTVET
jgi:nucleoid DNA-binding protein